MWNRHGWKYAEFVHEYPLLIGYLILTPIFVPSIIAVFLPSNESRFVQLHIEKDDLINRMLKGNLTNKEFDKAIRRLNKIQKEIAKLKKVINGSDKPLVR